MIYSFLKKINFKNIGTSWTFTISENFIKNYEKIHNFFIEKVLVEFYEAFFTFSGRFRFGFCRYTTRKSTFVMWICNMAHFRELTSFLPAELIKNLTKTSFVTYRSQLSSNTKNHTLPI